MIDLDAVLAWVNEERAKLDLEPLAALPKGEPRNPWCCPLAVCFDKENRGTATLVNATVIEPVVGSVEDYDAELIRIMHPQHVQEFVRAFDHGEIPELVVAGYDWEKGYVE